MFRSKEDLNTSSSAPSPAAIAAGVAKSGKHRELDAKITELSAERETVIAEMRELTRTNRSELNDPQIRKLEKKRVAIEDNLRPLRMEIRGHRGEHSKRVRNALRGTIHDAADSPHAQ
jgi:uncharacterized coiled-coil DUF342 family protein